MIRSGRRATAGAAADGGCHDAMESRILITNDDGYDSGGLRALVKAARGLGELWVVAPATEMSAIGHAVTLTRPMRVRRVGERRFKVSGTPTDCVFVAVGELMPEPPDLVLSGVNRGGNLAVDVTYSGTVGAAFEGALRGIPSVAVSLDAFRDCVFEPAAEIGVEVARELLLRGLPEGVLLNVNVPPLPRDEIRGVIPAPLGHRRYSQDLLERRDPRGNPYLWISGTDVTDQPIPGTDCIEVKRGYATVTPIQVDWTDGAALEGLRSWKLGGG